MTFRPSRTIYPPARYSDDADGPVSTHRRPVAPTLPALTPSQGRPTTATSTPSPSLDSVAPPRGAGGKCPAHNTEHTRGSSPSTSIDDPVDTPTLKKTRTLQPSDTLDDLGMHTDVLVMDMDDASDPREEALNKTDPTADLKYFFTSAPPAPGQTKARMRCNLCM